MKSCDNVIVTVALPKEQLDMELPAFLPAKELAAKLAETLRAYRPERYSAVFRLQLSSDGAPLNDTDTLASRGIWDGSILRCKPDQEVG